MVRAERRAKLAATTPWTDWNFRGLHGVLVHVVLVKMRNEAVPESSAAKGRGNCAQEQMEEQLLDGAVNILSVQDEK